MNLFKPKSISGSTLRINIYAAVVVFLAYTMIFGFRKSFTVATFDGILVAGYSYKTILVIAQVLGYMLAKFYGVKYISELKRTGRGAIILLLTGISWLSWLFFALVPAPYNIVFLFVNGFPLGMLWGVVFSYVEGRRGTDFIGAALAVSFIFASGFVRSAGGWLMLQFQSVGVLGTLLYRTALCCATAVVCLPDGKNTCTFCRGCCRTDGTEPDECGTAQCIH